MESEVTCGVGTDPSTPRSGDSVPHSRSGLALHRAVPDIFPGYFYNSRQKKTFRSIFSPQVLLGLVQRSLLGGQLALQVVSEVRQYHGHPCWARSEANNSCYRVALSLIARLSGDLVVDCS